MSRYIDADKLKSKLESEEIMYGGFCKQHLRVAKDCVRQMKEMLKIDVDNQPTADVEEVKHGKWIMCDTNIQTAMIFKCSECGRKIRVPLGNDYKKQYPYCHCGAKM